jgi:hypothetical protein
VSKCRQAAPEHIFPIQKLILRQIHDLCLDNRKQVNIPALEKLSIQKRKRENQRVSWKEQWQRKTKQARQEGFLEEVRRDWRCKRQGGASRA